jgi:hypothetical protein
MLIARLGGRGLAVLQGMRVDRGGETESAADERR